jgi:AraC-like DNA-binding protein
MFLKISENIFVYISAFGMLQGILLALLLYFHPRSDRSVTRFLALFILCITLGIIIPIGQSLFSWQTIIFIEPVTVLIGPFFYLYVRSFKERITFRKALPHVLIFPVYVLIAYFLYSEVGAKYPSSTVVPKEVTEHLLSRIPVSVRLLHRLFYCILAYRTLTTYQRSIRHIFSETSRINLNWMRWLINGYIVVTLTTIAMYIMILKYPALFSLWVLIIGVFVSTFIYIAAFKGLYQASIWQLPGVNKEMLEEKMLAAEKTQDKKAITEQQQPKTTSSDNRFPDIAGKVIALLTKEKLYREPELTLQHLADRLQLPSYLVSQAINEGMKKTFYDLVNGYRVEEAKRLLLDPSTLNYTILSVGFEAGFNSKTTFNTVFKKFTGQTPTAYRESHQEVSGSYSPQFAAANY